MTFLQFYLLGTMISVAYAVSPWGERRLKLQEMSPKEVFCVVMGAALFWPPFAIGLALLIVAIVPYAIGEVLKRIRGAA